jgi:uncharacterized membrane protein
MSLYIVPNEHVTLLEANSTDIMKMIVSGGISVKAATDDNNEDALNL